MYFFLYFPVKKSGSVNNAFSALAPNSRRLRLHGFVGSQLGFIEAPGAGSWLSVLVVLLGVSIAPSVALFEFDGGLQHPEMRRYSTRRFFLISSSRDPLILFRGNRQIPGLATGAVGPYFEFEMRFSEK